MIFIMLGGLVVYERLVDIMLGFQPFTGGIGFSLLHWTRTHAGTWMLYKDNYGTLREFLVVNTYGRTNPQTVTGLEYK